MSEENKNLEPPKPKLIPLTRSSDGAIINVDPKNVLELAQYGLDRLGEEPEEKKEEKKEEEVTVETRLEKAEDRINKMQKETEDDKRLTGIKEAMKQATNKYDLTKENPKVANKIQLLVAAKILQNPRLNIEEVFAEEVADFMGIEKDREEIKNKANEVAANASSGLVSSEGGMASIDTSQEFKAGDIKDGTSRRAFERFFKAQGG